MPAKRRSSSSVESAEDTFKEYPYDKLRTEKSIRLLRLQPGSRADGVHCELIEVQLKTEDWPTKELKSKLPGAGQATANGSEKKKPLKDEKKKPASPDPAAKARTEGSEKKKRKRGSNATQATDGAAYEKSRRPENEEASSLKSAAKEHSANPKKRKRNGNNNGTPHSANEADTKNHPSKKRKSSKRSKKDEPADLNIPFVGEPGGPQGFEAVSWSWGRVKWD